MNALINSQSLEIGKYKEAYEKSIGQTFPVTFAQYTGQEGSSERESIINNPPDILLTKVL